MCACVCSCINLRVYLRVSLCIRVTLTGGKEEETLALVIEIFANREECHESSNDSVAQELFRQLYMCIESCVKGMLLYDGYQTQNATTKCAVHL